MFNNDVIITFYIFFWNRHLFYTIFATSFSFIILLIVMLVPNYFISIYCIHTFSTIILQMHSIHFYLLFCDQISNLCFIFTYWQYYIFFSFHLLFFLVTQHFVFFVLHFTVYYLYHLYLLKIFVTNHMINYFIHFNQNGLIFFLYSNLMFIYCYCSLNLNWDFHYIHYFIQYLLSHSLRCFHIGMDFSHHFFYRSFWFIFSFHHFTFH